MIGTERIERGQVWYIDFEGDQNFGYELKSGRPHIIVSSREGCLGSRVLQCVPLTTSEKNNEVVVELVTPRRKSWALCNQVKTYDRQRLSSYMCRLSSQEMEKIDATLMRVFGFDIVGGCDEELLRLRLENDILKRTYEKAVEMLSEFKFVKDAPMIPKVEKNGLPVIPTDVRKLEEKFAEYDKKLAAEPEQMTLNLEPLKKIAAVEEPKPKATRKPRVKKAEPTPKKANVNTDDADTLAAKTGMAIEMANRIVEMREKYGGYDKLANLCIVPGIGKVFMEMYTAMLEV